MRTHFGRVASRVGLTPINVVTAGVGAVMVGLVAFAGTAGLRAAPYQEWIVVSAAFREKLTFVAPICAATAALSTSRLYRPASLLTAAIAPRSGMRQAVRPLLLVAAGTTAGYIAGFTPLALETSRTATDGTATVAPIITGLVYVAFCCIVGGLAGIVLNPIPAVLVAVSVTFLTTNVVLWLGEKWWAVGPVLGQNPQPGQLESTAVSTHRLLLVVAVSTSLLFVTHRLVDRGASRRQIAGAIFAATATIVVGVIASVGRFDRLYTFESDPTSVCRQTVQGTTVCFHRAHLRDLAMGLSSVERVQSRFPVPTREVLPGRLIDQSLAYAMPERDLKGGLIVGITPGGGAGMGQALAYTLSGVTRCEIGAEMTSQARLSSDIELWLSGASAGEYGDAPLNVLSEEEVQAGIRGGFHELHQCALTYERFLDLARGPRQ